MYKERKLKISQKQLENLLEDYKTMQIKELSLKYNICRATINNYINQFGIKRDRLDKQVVENIFKNLQDKEVQYWLGFLATDGAIFEDRISLSQKYLDRDVIEKFNKFLGIDKELKIKYHHKDTGDFPYVLTSFRNKEITKFLNKEGLTERKSLNLEINFPITFDFLRGAIDGDGCISIKTTKSSRNRIRLASASKMFIYQIFTFLELNNINSKVYKTRPNLYEIHIHRKDDLFKLIDNLYYDNCISMARKCNNAAQIRNNLMKTSETQGTIVKNPEANQQLIGE